MVNYCKFIRFRFNLFMENWQYNPWEELTQTERKNKKCANDRLFSLHILKIYRSFFSVSGWTMIRVSINRVYFYHWIKWSSSYIASSQSPAFQFGQVIRNSFINLFFISWKQCGSHWYWVWNDLKISENTNKTKEKLTKYMFYRFMLKPFFQSLNHCIMSNHWDQKLKTKIKFSINLFPKYVSASTWSDINFIFYIFII